MCIILCIVIFIFNKIQLQEFVSEDGAKDILREEKTWKRYKEALVSKVATKKAERSRDRRGIRVKLNPLAQTL